MNLRRQPSHARQIARAAVMLVLVTSVFSGCGFAPATNRVNTITHSATERSGVVDVLGSVLVSGQPGSGTLVVTFANSNADESVAVQSIEGAGEPAVEVTEFDPVELGPLENVVLAETGGVPVEGEFVPGDFAPVAFTFGDGSVVELDVPVVPACRQWEGLDDGPDDTDSMQLEAAKAEIEEPEGKAEEPAEVPDSDQSAYDCVFPEPFEH